MFFTDIGVSVPGITAKFCVSPVSKLVNKKANTSLETHCHSPYSLEANRKLNRKLLDNGTKSNSKKAKSVKIDDCPES